MPATQLTSFPFPAAPPILTFFPATGLYSEPSHYDMAHARKEFEVCCFSAIKELLNKTGERVGGWGQGGGAGVGWGGKRGGGGRGRDSCTRGPVNKDG
jgi:hypothetical protein